MTIVVPPPIDAMPVAPDPNDGATFSMRGFDFTSAQLALPGQINASAAATHSNALDALASATDALNYRNSAAINAITAASFSGAVLWVSGTTYTQGTVQYDPINVLPYRRKITGAGTTTPSADTTNYALLNTNQPLPVQDVSGAVFVQNGIHYRLIGPYNIYLMASPTVGTYLEITNNSGIVTSGITNNGKKIMGIDEGMFIDQINIKFGLYFTGDAFGWLVK